MLFGYPIDLNTANRILLIKLRHIGDVLLASATLKALKDARPDLSISMVVAAGTEEMIALNPAVDEVIPLRKHQGIVHDLRFIHYLRKKKFDVAINMTEGDRGAILAFLSGARHRIGVANKRRKGFLGKHLLFTHLIEANYNGRQRAAMDLDVLEPLGIPSTDPQIELFTSPEDDSFIQQVLQLEGITEPMPFAVVHPTSRWLFKCWRDEAVAGVIDYLQTNGLRVVLTSGPDAKEKEKLSSILSLATSKPVVLSGDLTLKQFAALLKQSTLFFGVDSAPMHMAAALDKPLVALFGPSDYRVWRPLGTKSRIVMREADFPCLPCRKDGCDGSKNSKCLEVITVEEVIDTIDELLCPGENESTTTVR
jgi:heptosyltransferase III